MKTINIDKIIEFVAQFYGLHPCDLKINNRNNMIIRARYVSMYFLRKYTKHSQQYIVDQFVKGQKHEIVLHAIKSVNNRMETNKEYANDIRLINEHFKTIAGYLNEEEVFQECDFYA